MQRNIPSDLLTYLLLRLMEHGPSYGYDMIKQLNGMSNAHWDISYGTVYGALNRLEKAGHIESCERDNDGRKYYQLTLRGRTNLKKRKGEMESMGDMCRNQVLGFLNVYRNVHGAEKFEKLLDDIKKEFA